MTDRLPAAELQGLQQRMHALLPDAVFVSAIKPGGLDPLRAELLMLAQAQRPVQEFRIPVSDGRTLAELHREGDVLEQRAEESELVIRARVSPALAGKLRGLGA